MIEKKGEHTSVKKWLLIGINLLLFLVIWWNRDLFYIWIADEEALYLPLVLLIVTLLAIFPVIPFGIVGGVIGAKYGLLWGSIVNIAASTLAAIIVYGLAASILNSWGSKLLKKYNVVNRMHQFINERLFWTILIARIIPIFPAVIVNVYAGVFKIRFSLFLLATCLGKIPAMLVFAYVGNGIWTNDHNWLYVLLIYSVFLLVIFLCYRVVLRKHRA